MSVLEPSDAKQIAEMISWVVAEGDTLDGWTVKEIAQDRVLLSSPAGDASLKLKPAASEPAKP